MGVYDFCKNGDISEVRTENEEILKVRNISFANMCWKIFTTFLLGLNIYYIQHFLFLENHEAESYVTKYFVAIFTIFVISEMVKFSFGFRMFRWNNYINEDKYNIHIVLVTAIFFTIVNFLLHFFYSKSIDQEKFAKMIYMYVFSPAMLFLQITSFLGHVLISYYIITIKFSKHRENMIKFSNLLTTTESDVALLSLLECFLRSAPLMIIQETYLLKNPEKFLHIPKSQIFSILITLFLMPWSITSYQGALRMNRHSETSVNTKSIYFSWHFFIMVSRISSVAAVTVFWPLCTAIFAFLHCLGATLWLLRKSKPMEFCGNNNFFHFLFCCVFGFVYFFYPVNVVKENTRWKYFWFYAIVFIQNAVANAFWFVKEDSMNYLLKIVFPSANFSFFALGIFCMILYYRFFHHKNCSESDKEDSSYPLHSIAAN